ncbi:hypothetical protein QTP86_027506, partial [Hemibagrus guttatus]
RLRRRVSGEESATFNRPATVNRKTSAWTVQRGRGSTAGRSMDPLTAETCTQDERSETFGGRLGASGGDAGEQHTDCERDEAAAGGFTDREEPLEEKMKGLAFRKQTSYSHQSLHTPSYKPQPDSGDDSGLQEGPSPPPPVILCDCPVTSVESFRFLDTTITKELKWKQNIRSLTKKAQQRMYFLRQLKKFLLPVKMLVNFYTAIIESILTSSITFWFAAATARDKAKLQRVIHSAEKVIGCSLPSLQELYVSRSRRRAAEIAADPSHPGNELFRSLPSGKRLRSIRTRTSLHKNSFFPTAVSLLNSAPLTPR